MLNEKMVGGSEVSSKMKVGVKMRCQKSVGRNLVCALVDSYTTTATNLGKMRSILHSCLG
jgi:hypothetical protein